MHGFYLDGARYNRDEAVIDDQIPVSTCQKLTTYYLYFVERTIQQDAFDLVQAPGRLRKRPGGVFLSLLQDWQACWCAEYNWAVNQLYHPRGLTFEGLAKQLGEESRCDALSVERLMGRLRTDGATLYEVGDRVNADTNRQIDLIKNARICLKWPISYTFSPSKMFIFCYLPFLFLN